MVYNPHWDERASDDLQKETTEYPQIQVGYRGMKAEERLQRNKKMTKFSGTFPSCGTGDYPHLEPLHNDQSRR